MVDIREHLRHMKPLVWLKTKHTRPSPLKDPKEMIHVLARVPVPGRWQYAYYAMACNADGWFVWDRKSCSYTLAQEPLEWALVNIGQKPVFNPIKIEQALMGGERVYLGHEQEKPLVVYYNGRQAYLDGQPLLETKKKSMDWKEIEALVDTTYIEIVPRPQEQKKGE